MGRRRKVQLTFFEELEALDTGFFHDLDAMIDAEAQERQEFLAEQARRDRNKIKALRIYPRLLRVEEFNCYRYVSHISLDFFGGNRDRVKAAKKLHEKRERIRWFLRALYNYWMFDIPMAHATPYMGLKYSRHRKWFLIHLRSHKRRVNKIRKVSRKVRQAERKARINEALDELKKSAAIARLRGGDE